MDSSDLPDVGAGKLSLVSLKQQQVLSRAEPSL